MRSKPKNSMTHAMCRANVCLFCFEKKTDCRLLSRTIALYQKVEFFTQFEEAIQFELNDNNVPTGVCCKCRKRVSQRELKREDFAHFNFDFVNLPENFESSSRKCSCSICQTAKNGVKFLNNQKPNSKGDNSNETTVPPSSSKIPKSRVSRPKERKHRCATCLQIIGRGIPHPQPCNTDRALEKNLKPIIHRSRATTRKVGGSIAFDVIASSKKSPNGTFKLFHGSKGGRPAPFNAGKAKPPTPKGKWKVQEILAQAQVRTWGERDKLSLCTMLNKKEPGSVEVNFQNILKESNLVFEDEFEISNLENDAGVEDPSLISVHVKDLDQYIQRVLNLRNLEKDRCLCKLMIDRGRGFLKYTLSVLDLDEDRKNVHFKSSSAQKSFVVAVTHLQESDSVLRQLFNKIKGWNCNNYVIFPGDLKVDNHLCGIGPCSSSYPCYACIVPLTDLENSYELRTFESIYEQNEKFQRPVDEGGAGGDKKFAKDCQSCIYTPILTENRLDPQACLLCLDMIPPPELHIVLGATKEVFKKLKVLFPQVNRWTDQLNLDAEKFADWEGNDCVKLLNNVDLLENLARDLGNFVVPPFVEAFRAFNSVRISCFGQELDPNYMNILANFRRVIKGLKPFGVKVTVKMHIVFWHVQQWINKYNVSLGIVSEQPGESCHGLFAKFWQRYRVDRKKFPDKYAQALLKMVIAFNSQHI